MSNDTVLLSAPVGPGIPKDIHVIVHAKCLVPGLACIPVVPDGVVLLWVGVAIAEAVGEEGGDVEKAVCERSLLFLLCPLS